MTAARRASGLRRLTSGLRDGMVGSRVTGLGVTSAFGAAR